VAILTTMKIKGDPDELLRIKQEKFDPVTTELAGENGGLEHLVAKAEDGLLIVNLWETVEGMEKMYNEVRPQADAMGLPRPSEWHQYELVQRVTP
jgi:hypothetical protein